MRTPSLKAIKTFQIAAKHSSFAVAADELCITPSAVSHQIKTLETQLGLPLFSRSARALALTEAGARYLEQIDDLFMRLESVTEQLPCALRPQQRATARARVLRERDAAAAAVGSSPKLHDGIDLRIETQGVHGRTHAASRHLDRRGLGSLERTDRASAVRADHGARLFSRTAARAAVLRYEDLNQHTLLVHEARREDWDRWAAAVGMKTLQPAQIVRIDSMSAATRAAEKSIGIALLPAELSAQEVRQRAAGARVR
jgi:LysR family glycine cleavage system transcriptional activator